LPDRPSLPGLSGAELEFTENWPAVTRPDRTDLDTTVSVGFPGVTP